MATLARLSENLGTLLSGIAAVVGSVMHDDEFVETALRMVQHALQQFALPMDADDQGEFGHD